MAPVRPPAAKLNKKSVNPSCKHRWVQRKLTDESGKKRSDSGWLGWRGSTLIVVCRRHFVFGLSRVLN